MSLLTDDDCRTIYNAAMELPNRSAVSVTRYIEDAVVAKLATVGVEPVAFHAQDGIVSVASHIGKDKFLFTTEALAAARVQAIEEAAEVAEGYPKHGDATAAEIRALIGADK